jgi:hypothetical protein
VLVRPLFHAEAQSCTAQTWKLANSHGGQADADVILFLAMPASRRYTRAQRDAILALHARGLSSSEIAVELASGYESVDPCKIPARSIRHIVQREARDRRSSDPDPAICERGNPFDAPIFKRLERAQNGWARGPGPLTEQDAQPCDGWDGRSCSELAIEVRPTLGRDGSQLRAPLTQPTPGKQTCQR